MVGIGLALLVMMQTASRAILVKTSPPGSLGLGSREELPIVTRPAAASATPMSEPPWRSLKLTQCPQTLRYFFASSEASGATEVDPLIVMVGLAAAAAGNTSDAASTAAASIVRGRMRFIGIACSSRSAGFRPTEVSIRPFVDK